MNCRHRPTEPQDFPACLALMYDGFLHDNTMRAQMAALWGEVLAEGRGVSAVVEEVPPDGTRRLVGFGLTVFVTQRFASELRTGALPYYTTCILERHPSGKSPILSRAAVRADNAGGGLTVASFGVGHIGPADAPPDVFHAVMAAMLASSQAAHRGYNICEAFTEACGEPMRDQLLAGGLRLRCDYKDYFAHDPHPPPPEQHPYLLGLTRAEAVARPFDTFSYWFHHNRPRFGFTPAQQQILRYALAGQTDEGLARSLSVSRWTVKKRWQSIYAEVEAVHPGLLPPEGGAEPDGTRPTRGAERRRHLLHYLREHLEELRP